MSSLSIDVAWAYEVGSEIGLVTNFDALSEANVNANVCIDMFLAPNGDDATNPEKATIEVMVWLGKFGYDTMPLGFTLGELKTEVIDGVTL